jgi:predicted secreted Zn-dependent protease
MGAAIGLLAAVLSMSPAAGLRPVNAPINGPVTRPAPHPHQPVHLTAATVNPVPFGALHLDQPTSTIAQGGWVPSGGAVCTFGAPPANEPSSPNLAAGPGGTGTFTLTLGNGIALAGPVLTGPAPATLQLNLVFTRGPETAQMDLSGYGPTFKGTASFSVENCTFTASLTLTLGGTGLTALLVTSVSPARLPIVPAHNPGPTITVSGTGFTGATSVRFSVGGHGAYITSQYFKVNAAGTAITFVQPVDLVQNLSRLGPGPDYTLDTQVTLHQVFSAINAPADQITFTGPQVTHVSPAQLSIVPAHGPGPTITVTGTGFTGATSIRFAMGNHGVYITSQYFTVNAAGTAIKLEEPVDLAQKLPPHLGRGPDYTLDARVSIHQLTSAVNAPADQITFTGPKVTHVSPAQLSIVPAHDPGPTITVTGTGFTGATSLGFAMGRHSVFVSAADFKVNDAGTTITVLEPTNFAELLPRHMGRGPDYTLDVRVSIHQVRSAVNAPADQITLTGPKVTHVSPAQLSIVPAQNPGPTITVTGTGFTGATSLGFAMGRHSVFVSAADFTVNDTGTTIKVVEPVNLADLLPRHMGLGPDYTLDVRVSIHQVRSAVNAPADQITFHRSGAGGPGPPPGPVSPAA